MKERLLIIGAGGHGKVVADIALKMNQWDEICFLDDDKTKREVMGLKVIDSSSNVKSYLDDSDFFVAIGDNSTRKKVIEELLVEGIQLPTLLHPNAVIGQDVKIGQGTVIMAGVVINCCTEIGEGCIINTSSSIDHDNMIRDYVHISPGSNLAGSVKIGKETWVGTGSTVINNIEIYKKSIIGAGSLVIRDVKQEGTYIGTPLKKM